jgi:phage shock protein PspC (stress-responsive transcriptional regulator)
MPLAIRDLVQAGYMLAVGRALLHPGLSALVHWTPAPVDRLVYGVLGGIDLFTLWTAVLLVVGVVVTSRFGRGRAALAMVLYLVLALSVLALPAVATGSLLAR